MQYVNAHTHRVPETGVTAVVNIHQDSIEVPDYGLYSAGIHPWFIREEHLKEDFSRLRRMLKAGNVVAIGECGLDRLAKASHDLQRRVFEQHLLYAEEFNKPVIIHNVRSSNELLQIRNSTTGRQPWLLHGFHGSTREAELFLKKGCLFGFGRHLFNPKSKSAAACYCLPSKNILPETDDANIPVQTVIERISEIKEIDLQQITEQMIMNFVNFFNLEDGQILNNRR